MLILLQHQKLQVGFKSQKIKELQNKRITLIIKYKDEFNLSY